MQMKKGLMYCFSAPKQSGKRMYLTQNRPVLFLYVYLQNRD
jgi:hypothetical protein